MLNSKVGCSYISHLRISPLIKDLMRLYSISAFAADVGTPTRIECPLDILCYQEDTEETINKVLKKLIKDLWT